MEAYVITPAIREYHSGATRQRWLNAYYDFFQVMDISEMYKHEHATMKNVWRTDHNGMNGRTEYSCDFCDTDMGVQAFKTPRWTDLVNAPCT